PTLLPYTVATPTSAIAASTLTSTLSTLPTPSVRPLYPPATYNCTLSLPDALPISELAPNTTYTAKLDSTIKAADGVPLAGPVSWGRSTSNLPPYITSHAPGPASDVSALVAPTATFSRAMDASTITSSSFTLHRTGG